MIRRLVLTLISLLAAVLAAVLATTGAVPAQAAGSTTFKATWQSTSSANGYAVVRFSSKFQSRHQFDYLGSITDVCNAQRRPYSDRSQGAVVVRQYYKSQGRLVQLSVATHFSANSDASCATTSFSVGGRSFSKPVAAVTVQACEYDRFRSTMSDCVTRRLDNPLVA